MSDKYKKVSIAEDGEGIWYLLDEGELDTFFRDMEDDDMTESGAFAKKYRKNKLGDNPNKKQLFVLKS